MILRAVGIVFVLRDLVNPGKVGIEIFRSVGEVRPMEPQEKCADEDTNQRSGTDASGHQRNQAPSDGGQQIRKREGQRKAEPVEAQHAHDSRDQQQHGITRRVSAMKARDARPMEALQMRRR